MNHWRAKLLLLALPLTGTAAWAQLDLPTKPSQGAKKPEPKHPALPAPTSKGNVAPGKHAEPLDLPPGAASEHAPAAAPDASTAPIELARALFRELAAARDLARAAPLIERLLALGPEVLSVARGELASDRPACQLAAGRLCLMGGTSDDRAAVAERVAHGMPVSVAAPLFDELLARDPMLASPEYLAGLLEHPSSALRTRAARALEPRVAPSTLSALAPVLESTSAAARASALELVARVNDPLAWNLLASRLGDPNARLAQRAASLLAGTGGAEALLLERAFPAGAKPDALAWDRARGYALLALVEREDDAHAVLVDSTRVEALLGGLASPQPLVAGACAVVLARVGFRSPAAETERWLDRDVPHQLVRAGTGAEFHADFSSLEQPAQRALALITGASFGPDGDAWRRWWVDNAASFHARHAVIELGEEAAARLLVQFEDARGRRWTLLGPERQASGDPARTLRLDPAAAERLLGRLQAEGVFGVERLPDPERAGAPSALVVEVGAQEKRFAGGLEAPWIPRLAVELGRCVEENEWQLYYDPARTGAAEWWQSEQARFAALEPLERRLAVKRLLIEAVGRASGAVRDERLAELRELYAQPEMPEAADFEPLFAALAGEGAYAPRGELLFELLRVAAVAKGAESDGATARARLVALGLERFGPEADAELARLARELAPTALQALARDARPRARALAPEGLLRAGAEPELVHALFADPDPAVRLALLTALVANPREELRTELLALARTGALEERPAALRALVRLGGKDVQDLALEALGDGEASVQLAGVEALAELADPGSASLFAALLARGSSSPLYPAARRGLQRLGAAGIDECLRLAHTAGARARREAALLLSEALVPEAAGVLLTLLTEDPHDERVAWELSVLAGQDFSAEEHPEKAAWNWWDVVVHDDPDAWLCAAAERAGVSAPAPAVLQAKGVDGARFLLAVATLPSPPLVERATRGLEHLLGCEFARPSSNQERARFLDELREAVRARFGE